MKRQEKPEELTLSSALKDVHGPEEAEGGHSSRGKSARKGLAVRKLLRTVRQPAWPEWDELGKGRPSGH